ncbi:MAG: hypothetical protein DRK00_09265 [Thermoprotei archaeon]|nr:MAG: hypothetical protein DRK00_09265 [Thermoprotei archaeon]
MHERAREFFKSTFPRLRVYMSTHQLAEIYYVLAFRRARIPRGEAESIVRAIIEDGSIIKVPLTLERVEEVIQTSAESGVHVWDYLCFLPVKDYVNTVFTCDRRFLKIGGSMGLRRSTP